MRHRYTIAHRGLKEGGHRFQWRAGDDFWASYPEGGIIRGDVKVVVSLEKGAATFGEGAATLKKGAATFGGGAATFGEGASTLEKRATSAMAGAGGAAGAGGTDGAMRLTFEMVGNVTVPCDRCLEDCEIPVHYKGRLLVKIAVDGEEPPFEGDILWLRPGAATIDLGQYIYESVVLSLPLQRIHPEDVHGRPLCNPAMLEWFKIVSEDEFDNIHKYS
jgi:hypothetical protein